MISVLIPTMPKNEDYLALCVKSLMDNSVSDIEIIVEEDGGGQCEKVNKAFKKAKGDFILISNDDMYYPPQWDKDLTFPSECFSPNVNWTHDPVSGLEYVELNAGRSIEEFDKEAVDRFMSNYSNNVIENGFHFPVFFSRKLFKKIGGYDERYDPWGSNSDSDLEYKAVLAGVQPKIHRGVFVYHFGGKAGTFDQDKQSYWQKNWDYFIDKWGFSREETPWIQKADLHIPLDKLKYKPNWSVYK